MREAREAQNYLINSQNCIKQTPSGIALSVHLIQGVRLLEILLFTVNKGTDK